MHKKIYQLLLAIIGSIGTLTTWAQDSTSNSKVAMADAMRSNGKIYVVIAVLLIILFGLFLYVIRLDKKISRLEKENKDS
ncbi:MAG: CcmD family protein [Bacteroidetes bacterium]|nr:CcmD family protein [Bacteroidota bacterium]